MSAAKERYASGAWLTPPLMTFVAIAMIVGTVASLAFLIEGLVIVACHARGRDEGYGALVQRSCERREWDDASLLPGGPGLHHLP